MLLQISFLRKVHPHDSQHHPLTALWPKSRCSSPFAGPEPAVSCKHSSVTPLPYTAVSFPQRLGRYQIILLGDRDTIAQDCYQVADRPGVELATFRLRIQHLNHWATKGRLFHAKVNLWVYEPEVNFNSQVNLAHVFPRRTKPRLAWNNVPWVKWGNSPS